MAPDRLEQGPHASSLALAPQQLSPLTVRQLCIQLDGSFRPDPHVLAVAQALLRLPMPLSWKHAIADGNRSVYIDKRTGLATPAHPSLKEGRRLLKLLRATANQSHPSQEDNAGPPQTASAPAPQHDEQPTQPPQSSPESSPATEQPAAAAQGHSSSSQTCILFPGLASSSSDPVGPQGQGEASGSGYWFDFAADAVCKEQPGAGRVVPAVPRHLLQQCGLVPVPTEAPTHLTFYSWWYEDMESPDLTLRVSSGSVVGGGLRRHYCTIQFDIEQQAFAIRTSAEDQELALGSIYAVTSSSGTTVNVWDLHVGATLVILGKRVTLLKADLPTAQWNELHATRLCKLKQELQLEVQKYRPRAHPGAITYTRGSQTDVGGMALKPTIAQIHTLIADLRQYRPSKADAYQAHIGIEVN